MEDVFDWKSAAVITQAEFESKLKAAENKAGAVFSSPGRAFQKIEDVKHETRLSFSEATGVKATILGGLYAFESATVASHADGLKTIEYTRLKEVDGRHFNPLRAVGMLDGIFGGKHELQGNFHIWNTGLYLVQFFQYSNSSEYALRFQRVRQAPAAQDAPMAVKKPAATPAPPSPGAGVSSRTTPINLDDFFDWKNPMNMTAVDFQARIQALEVASTTKVRVSDRTPHFTYYFDPSFITANGGMSVINGRYQVSNAYFQWTASKISDIRVTLSPVQNGRPLNLPEEVAHLDTFLGLTHGTLSGGGDVWRWPDCQVRFYKYSNADSYCIELDNHVHSPLASSSSLPPTPLPTPTSATSSPSSPVAPPATSIANPPFKLKITQVNGLLISPLSSGEEAGQSTKMTLTALPDRGRDQTLLEFNQEVGGDMRRCLLEVSKHSQIRHQDWPLGYTLQIGFEDKYIPKDGPSAAVACALLVESAVTGKKWDPAFAVTGDMNADGSVQPIGGVRAKVRGATKGGCRLIAVPSKNEAAIPDILLLDGPEPLISITAFGIKTFDDAMVLASPERPKALSDALLNFEAMRPTLMRDPRQILPLLRTPQGNARLQALLQAAPNCYSAKYLLLLAQGRAPRTLSIGGSIEAAQSSAKAIINSIENDVESNVNTLKPDEVGTSLNRLRSLRPKLDQRVWPYVDGLVDYGDVVRGAILNPVRSGARFADLVAKARKAAASAQTAFKALMNNAEVQEELGL